MNEALWYPNSAALLHMIPLEGIFYDKLGYNDSYLVIIRNGTHFPIRHVWHVQLPIFASPLHLEYVLHVPHLEDNLFSVQKVCHDNN